MNGENKKNEEDELPHLPSEYEKTKHKLESETPHYVAPHLGWKLNCSVVQCIADHCTA